MNKGFHAVLAGGIRRQNCPFMLTHKQILWDHDGKRTGSRWYGWTPGAPIGENGDGGSRLRSHPLSFIDSHPVVGPKIASRRERLPIIRISVEGRVKRIARL